jgi:hypothetical protein
VYRDGTTRDSKRSTTPPPNDEKPPGIWDRKLENYVDIHIFWRKKYSGVDFKEMR